MPVALAMLRRARDHAGERAIITLEVQLALITLIPHCPEAAFLLNFWDATSRPFSPWQSAGLTAACNGIERQLRLAGKHPDERDCRA